MSVIGGGNRVGGPPQGPVSGPGESGAPRPTEQGGATPLTSSPPQREGDDFTRQGTLGAGATRSAAFPKEGQAADLARIAKENPAAAMRMASGLHAQARGVLSEVESELVAARGLMERLVAERFSKRAGELLAAELRARREKLHALKRRYHVAARKLALLQKVAGKLKRSDLEEELEKITGHHRKLKSGWGKRHHLLSLGESVHGAEHEAPQHLQEVRQAEVRTAARSGEVQSTMHHVTPGRVLAQLIARTLDGSTPGSHAVPASALRGEFGRAIQAYATLTELVQAAAGSDLFASKGSSSVGEPS